ncbi:MAG: flippase-like domain-containing protein [Ardenticatenales bacterium]|nr:flippase-like domain-containing protein [Ardenticatenales bacterium]
MENSSIWRRPQFWIGMIISLLCLGAIFWIIDPAEIWSALQTANYAFLLLSALGLFVAQILRGYRWRFMLGNKISFGNTFHIINIGFMFNYLLPLRLGEAIRAVLIGNVPPLTVAQGLSTMIVERLFDLLFIVTLLPFTLANAASLPDNLRLAARTSGVLAIIGVIILIVAANQRPLASRIARAILDRLPLIDGAIWGQRFDELMQGLDSLTRLGDAARLIGFTLLVWLPIIAAYYWGLLAVGITPTWSMAAFTVCAAALSIAAPSSPGQVGVYHGGVIFALTQIMGQPEGPAAAFAFLYHAINFLLVLILGVIGIFATGATFGRVLAVATAWANRDKSV